MLAVSVDYTNPLFWAILVGWIISVILHEFAHGIVAYWGGDYTIRERGGLTLNPLQYVDPFGSLLLPAIFLALGGVPLPGGSTYIRRDLLRSRGWEAAVSLAGPAMNFLLFLVCALPLHPWVEWIDPGADPATWSNFQIFLGAMAVLQFIAILFNLVPVPPLDGFQTIAPFLPEDLRFKLSTPPVSTLLFFGYFAVLWSSPRVMTFFLATMVRTLDALQFDFGSYYFMLTSFRMAIWGVN